MLMLLQGEGYLVLEDWPTETPGEEPAGTQSSAYNDVVDSDVLHGVDCATVFHENNEAHFLTYHIIYNDIYRVPKLLLKGRYSDGKPIDWQDILQILPAGLSNDDAKWTFLTYEEHPYLHMPWLALHPCGTSELMRMVFSTSSVDCHQVGNNVSLPTVARFHTLAWLSFVSQAVALKLPKGFSQCFEAMRNMNC
ncbi:hypothetical protein GOP47_0028745 [Adiantum capillus-veneris]|nr:hypothetical protein GOP47_0028745 [Adiantum capillus-veneris]